MLTVVAKDVNERKKNANSNGHNKRTKGDNQQFFVLSKINKSNSTR